MIGESMQENSPEEEVLWDPEYEPQIDRSAPQSWPASSISRLLCEPRRPATGLEWPDLSLTHCMSTPPVSFEHYKVNHTGIVLTPTSNTAMTVLSIHLQVTNVSIVWEVHLVY